MSKRLDVTIEVPEDFTEEQLSYVRRTFSESTGMLCMGDKGVAATGKLSGILFGIALSLQREDIAVLFHEAIKGLEKAQAAGLKVGGNNTEFEISRVSTGE